MQSGARHLLREVQDLAQECPAAAEVQALVRPVAPQLALARERRMHPLAAAACSRQAATLKVQIMASRDAPSHHLGLPRIQEILRAQADRLEPWADDRRVPAEHNLAERDLRPPVIARNVSFGSPSDAGAHTRGVLMSGLHTLKKRQVEVGAHLKTVLDHLALDLQQDPFPLLFPETPT